MPSKLRIYDQLIQIYLIVQLGKLLASSKYNRVTIYFTFIEFILQQFIVYMVYP